MLACPICRTHLQLHHKTYICAHRHSYDVAKDGYINLHIVQHKNSHHAGDTALSVQARRRFLSNGFYEPLQEKIAKIVNDLRPKTVLDIGCGEGYYTSQFAQHAQQVVGLDIAKIAIMTASKTYKNTNKNIVWTVGTGAVLPILDNSVDMCTSLFSPLPKTEILRVLKTNGYLLMAMAAPNHLHAMRQQLFDTINPHNPTKFINELSPEFTLTQTWHIDSPMVLDSQNLADLIDMTPYTYRAKLDKKTALKAQNHFLVTACFCVYLFKKSQ